MAELLARSATWGLEPVNKAGLTLTPLAGGPVHSIAILPQGHAAVTKALEEMQLYWPAPGQIIAGPQGRLVWSGREEALLFDATPPKALQGHAAVVNQTGAMAGFAITGAGAPELLARLVPLDLRPKVFPVGSAARSLARHVPVLVLHPNADRYELHAPRSMAQSLWIELTDALDRLAARKG